VRDEYLFWNGGSKKTEDHTGAAWLGSGSIWRRGTCASTENLLG